MAAGVINLTAMSSITMSLWTSSRPMGIVAIAALLVMDARVDLPPRRVKMP